MTEADVGVRSRLAVQVDAVTFAYPGQPAPVVNDVSFRVASGESAAIVGPSGSGKTTLLSIVGGLVAPTAGSVRRDGPAVAWVTQTTNVLGRRTVRDNAALGAFLGDVGWAQSCARADDALASVGLAPHAHQQARQLSGGELQRLCIARSIAMRARLVLADEPTGQLDGATSRAVTDVLLAIRDRGAGLLVATHDLTLAHRCDHVLVLADGRLRPHAGRG